MRFALNQATTIEFGVCRGSLLTGETTLVPVDAGVQAALQEMVQDTLTAITAGPPTPYETTQEYSANSKVTMPLTDDLAQVLRAFYDVENRATDAAAMRHPKTITVELIAYLADHGDFWDQKRGDAPWGVARATAFVNSGWAPTGVVINGKFHEGTSLAALTPNPPTPAPPAES